MTMLRYTPSLMVGEYIDVHSQLDDQMRLHHLTEEMTEDGLVMSNADGDRIFVVTNEGLIVFNMRMCSWYSNAVATFFRELLGKNISIWWSRGNYRLLIYDHDKRWYDEGCRRYSRTDILTHISAIDLNFQPVAGLKKMQPRVNRNKQGKRIRTTTSRW